MSTLETELAAARTEIDRLLAEKAAQSMCVLVPVDVHDAEQAELARLRADLEREHEERTDNNSLLVGQRNTAEAQRDDYLDALHQCYAYTGADCGDRDDFRALVDHHLHTVSAVRELREDRDALENAKQS